MADHRRRFLSSTTENPSQPPLRRAGQIRQPRKLIVDAHVADDVAQHLQRNNDQQQREETIRLTIALGVSAHDHEQHTVERAHQRRATLRPN